MAKNNNLTDFLTSLANKFRSKLRMRTPINPQNFDTMVDNVYTQGSTDLVNPQTRNGTDFGYFFYGSIGNSTYLPPRYYTTTLPSIDTSKGTNFNYMFGRLERLLEVPQIDTSKGTTFSGMFSSCRKITTIPYIDTSNGTYFNSMFINCVSLTSIPNLNVANGTNFAYMFRNCPKLTAVPALNTSKGTDFSHMFMSCTNLKSIGGLNTSNGTNFLNMFSGCSSLVTAPTLNVSNATTLSGIFGGCTALKNIAFTGTIGANISLSGAPSLTLNSLKNVINVLGDFSGTETTHILTLHANHKQLLSNAGSTAPGGITWVQYANNKGWTVD